MSTAKSTICCCGAEGWTKAIASLQIISNFIYLVRCSVDLPRMLSEVDKITDASKDLVGSNTKVKIGQARNLVQILMILCIVVSAVGLLFGILLFVGASQKNRALLNAWIALTLLNIVGVIVITILTQSYLGQTDAANIVRCIWSIAFLLWAIWIVTTFKRESCVHGISEETIGGAPPPYPPYPGPGFQQNQHQQPQFQQQTQFQMQQGPYPEQNVVKVPPTQWNSAPWNPV